VIKTCIPFVLLLTLTALTVQATTTLISPSDNNIRYVGRFDMSNPKAPRMYWSGSHIIAWFRGNRIAVQLNCEAGDDHFNIIIDDSTVSVHALKKGLQTITIAGLDDGEHKIEVFKRTSFQKDNTSFEGFVIDEGTALVKLKAAPKYKIEFFGDSITDGHSVDAIGDNEASAWWNNYMTYAARTARALGMQYACIASSGIAVKYGWTSEHLMKNYYDLVNPGKAKPIKWDFSQYTPDVVVVNLLQNDAFKKPHPHSHIVKQEIIVAYKQLIEGLRGKYPQAYIVCVLGNMSATDKHMPWPSYIKAVVADLRAQGDDKIDTIIFEFMGLQQHPNAKHHEAMAQDLIKFIRHKVLKKL
jgi:hypothetical protein